MFQQINPKTWCMDQNLKFLGLEMGARMTVIDTSGAGDLLIHSPIRPTEALKVELNKLGQVRYILAPNLFHHLFAADFKSQFPGAKLYCAPGLEKKRSDVSFDEVIKNECVYPWSETLKHHVIEGSPFFNEVVVFDSENRTLIVTDLGIHICEDSPFLTRLVFRSMGMFKKFGWSGLEKWLFIKDPEAFKKSIENILDWDFDQIVLSHGKVIKENGRDHFKKAFS